MVRTREETRCKFLSNLYATDYLVSFKNIPLWLTFRGIILKNILFEMIGIGSWETIRFFL